MTYIWQDGCLKANQSGSNDLHLAECMWRYTTAVHMAYIWPEGTSKRL